MSLWFYKVGEWQIQIRSDDDWRWYYDEEHDRMIFDLANDMLFRSRSVRKMLTPNAFSPVGFRIDDAVLHSSFEKKRHDFNSPKEQKVELVLNALVAIRYPEPQAPRSWHFVLHGKMWMSMSGDATYVWLSDTHKQVDLLVVESGENVALCLLARPCVVIADRAMQSGDAIKIMNDRLKPQVNVGSFSLGQVV